MTGDMPDLKALIGTVAQRKSLSEAEAERAFDIIMSGNATPAQMGAFLMALRVRGETVEEITGAARDAGQGIAHRGATRRDRHLRDRWRCRGNLECFDGDGAGGRRNRRAGCQARQSRPFFEVRSRRRAGRPRCQYRLRYEPGEARAVGSEYLLRRLRDHSAMRHVGPTRVELGTRTIFNLLGPLSNPAVLVDRLSAYSRRPGSSRWRRCWAILAPSAPGSCMVRTGPDELTTTGSSQVAECLDGKVRSFEVTPEQVGLQRARPEDLRGGDPASNARALRDLLGGASGPYRDIVLLNSAAALLVAGKVDRLPDGVRLAAEVIDNGHAHHVLDRLVEITNQVAGS